MLAWQQVPHERGRSPAPTSPPMAAAACSWSAAQAVLELAHWAQDFVLCAQFRPPKTHQTARLRRTPPMACSSSTGTNAPTPTGRHRPAPPPTSTRPSSPVPGAVPAPTEPAKGVSASPCAAAQRDGPAERLLIPHRSADVWQGPALATLRGGSEFSFLVISLT